jgi:hypothetical protein
MVGLMTYDGRGLRRAWWSPVLAAALVAGLAASANAQTAPGLAPAVHTSDTAKPEAPAPPLDAGLQQTGCASCAGGLLGLPPFGGESDCGPGGCGSGGCNGCCYAGRKPCDCCCNSDNCFGRFFGGLYECICCPDPCYEPHWIPLADSAFFADAPRPMTQMRFRGDFGWNLEFPDRSEFFWARADGHGKGPTPFNNTVNRNLDYQQGSLYTEAAIQRLGVFVEVPYLHVSPNLFDDGSGIGDINVGTKTLLLDCDLILLSFQFRTYIPTGNFSRGLGTGHASLEPSLLMSLKLSPTTYLQGQVSYWFAVGGDQTFEGNVFHYHFSLNQLIWNCGHDVQLIATFEAGGYEFSSGDFTDPVTLQITHAQSVGSVFNVGPGLRLSLCDKIDFGVGTQFSITTDHLAEELVRAEFRMRF